MKKIMLMAVALLAATSLSAQVPIFPGTGTSHSYENTIVVTGKAEKEVVPDEFFIRIVINESQLKQRQTVEQLETEMIRNLKSLGVDTDKNLKIGNMSSAYKDYLFNRNTPRTSATYELKVDGIALLGKVYQSLGSLGISNMNITRLGHSKLKEFQNELRIEAMKNAKEIASALAEAVGQSAGKAVLITDYNNDLYMPAPSARGEVMMMRGYTDTAALYETELEFREIKLSYSVSVKFALE
jgi:uncharacterized protein YggE